MTADKQPVSSSKDDDSKASAASPYTGFSSAMAAGDILNEEFRRRARGEKGYKRSRIEMSTYLIIQCGWFIAFGMQTVLFAYLLKNVLQVSGTALGIGQMALALPSVIFILFGGVLAERADGRWILVILNALAIIPAIFLTLAVKDAWLNYTVMIVYALSIGTIGAFMMPARDAILNEVVARRSAAGSSLTLQQGVTMATMVQFVGQIAGLLAAGYAKTLGTWPILIGQASCFLIASIAGFFLLRGQTIKTGRSGLNAAFGDIADGVKTVFKNPILAGMTCSMFGVGTFIIGGFLVVLPIINADSYGMHSQGLTNLFITFWAGACVSSVALTMLKGVKQPGRLFLLAQLYGGLSILFMMMKVPYSLFLILVFSWGLAAGISITMSRSIVQGAAPPDKLARVLSIYQMGFMAGAPLGAFLLGFLTDQVGLYRVALVPSICMTLIVVLIIFFTPIWSATQEELENQSTDV